MTLEEAINYFKRSYASGDTDDERQHNEAIDIAIKAIKALEQTRWIPVSERLPERAEWYLTSIKRVDGAVIISWFDGVSFKAEIVAWMPLPQPYKAESEEQE